MRGACFVWLGAVGCAWGVCVLRTAASRSGVALRCVRACVTAGLLFGWLVSLGRFVMCEFMIEVRVRGVWTPVELIVAKDAVAAQRLAWRRYVRRFGQVRVAFA